MLQLRFEVQEYGRFLNAPISPLEIKHEFEMVIQTDVKSMKYGFLNRSWMASSFKTKNT